MEAFHRFSRNLLIRYPTDHNSTTAGNQPTHGNIGANTPRRTVTPVLVPINVLLRRPSSDVPRQVRPQVGTVLQQDHTPTNIDTLLERGRTTVRSPGNINIHHQGVTTALMEEIVPTARDQWQAFFQQRQNSDNNVPDGNRPVVLSVENLRSNTHWGDILQEKSDSVTRVYSMNVNGISLDRRGGKFATVC
jgi:hypothetical protein